MTTKLTIMIAMLSLLMAGSAWAEIDAHSGTFIDQERLADAIYKAENSIKYPYGIKSVNTHGDKVYARKICLNTINNNLARWQWAKQNGDKRDFIEFLGARYAPTKGATDDPTRLNNNWVGNVKRLYMAKLGKSIT